MDFNNKISHGEIYAPLRCSRVCVESRSGCCSQAAKRLRRYGRRTTHTEEARYIATTKNATALHPNKYLHPKRLFGYTHVRGIDGKPLTGILPQTASIRCAEEAPRAELLLIDPLPSPTPPAPTHLGLKVALRHHRAGEGLCNLSETKPEWPH